jgi:hypothetical protein
MPRSGALITGDRMSLGSNVLCFHILGSKLLDSNIMDSDILGSNVLGSDVLGCSILCSNVLVMSWGLMYLASNVFLF